MRNRSARNSPSGPPKGALEDDLHLNPGVSRRLEWLTGSLHSLAIGSLLLTPLPETIRWAALSVLILSYAYGVLDRVFRFFPWSLDRVIWAAQGDWCLYLKSGHTQEARLLPSTYVSPFLVVLRFRLGCLGTRSLVLFPDQVDADTLRRLRVRLRLQGAPSASVHSRA